MFGFIKQTFVSAMMFFGSLSRVNPLKCISMKNQECKVRPEIVDVSSNNPIFHPVSIKTNNVVVFVIMFMIHMQEFVFLMMLKI